MDNDLEQQIEKRLAELPEDVRNAITSNDTDAHVREIGAKHGLHVDQIGALVDEVMLVMLGFAAPEEFTAQIASRVNVPPADASQIADEVTQQLFMPIRASMMQFMDARSKADMKPTVPAPAPVAPKPAPTLPMAEKILTEKTVVAPPAAEKPISKVDPYREPIE